MNFRTRAMFGTIVLSITVTASQWLPTLFGVQRAGAQSEATCSPTLTQAPKASPSPSPTPDPSPAEPPKESEASINQRNDGGNGIAVGDPKVYDDTLLQQMLQNAEAKLAAMQILDQSGVAAKLGSIVGASQQISSLGLNISGPSIPQTVTTANEATGSTVTTQAPTGTTTATTSGLPVNGVVTTLAQANPPSVSAPAPSTSMPSSFSVSASNLLNEQMQLTYEIANLRLLLEGSLTDRFDKSKKNVKPRVTIGFPIALEPDKRYKDAIAIVEIEIQTASNTTATLEKPVITALLPREKTYNVAAIKDKSTSIGGGVATQLLGASVSWLRGRKTYYLVQDQDTLATVFQPQTSNHLGFLWQFRPVLGQRYVRSQLTQTFVQVAFDKARSADVFGWACVRTYWRKYDRKTGIVGEVIPDSLRNCLATASIPGYRLIPTAGEIPLNVSKLEDLGNGQMIVTVPGSFLDGTSIRVGTATLGQGSANFAFNQQMIRFVATIADLATKNVTLVARDGNEDPLMMERQGCKTALNVGLQDISISTVDQNNSLLKVKVNDCCFLAPENPPLLLVLGGRVFGYADAPVERYVDPKSKAAYLTAVVPNSLLLAAPELIVKSLFQDKDYEARVPMADRLNQGRDRERQDSVYLLSQTERLSFIGQDPKTSKYEFLLYGSRLKDAVVLRPECSRTQPNGTTGTRRSRADGDCVQLEQVGRPEDADTLRRIELSPAQLNTQKYLVLQRPGERPFSIQIPSVDSKDVSTDFKQAERVIVGADEVMFNGEIKDLTKVTFNGSPITAQKASDNKSVILKGLSGSGLTATPTTKTVVFWFNDKKVEVKIEVVNSKIETIAK
jgi:hypothetical protein